MPYEISPDIEKRVVVIRMWGDVQPDEVRTLLRDLRAVGTDVATIGQYLQPTRRNLPVVEYVEPRQFEEYREYGQTLGFKAVFSGPLVRSSYMADLVSDGLVADAAQREPC